MEVVYGDTHPDRLLVLGAAFHNWISTDFGKTFSRVRLAGTQQPQRPAACDRQSAVLRSLVTQVETPGRTLGFWMECKVHPTQPDWLLAKVRRMECEEAGSATNPWCAFDLFVSQARASAHLLHVLRHMPTCVKA